MKKQLLTATLLTLFFMGFHSIYSQEKIDESITEAIQSVHTADMQSDFKLYMENHAFFERCLAMDANNYLAKYYLAYVEYKLYQSKQADTKVDVDKYYDTALEYCKSLMNNKKYEAEAGTIMAGLYMMHLAVDQMQAMSLMPKIYEMLDAAEAAPGSHPRALIIKGIMQLKTPAMFGGSVGKAIESFLKAVNQFETDKKDNPINWGYEESLAWLGQAYAESNQPEKAREVYAKALKLEPDYKWIKYVLLPALDKKNN